MIEDPNEARWAPDTSVPLLESTVGGILREAAAAAPDLPAMIEGLPGGDRRVWTYSELLAESLRTAHALRARFEPGERLALWAPNCPEWVVVQLGAALSGLVLVTVNPALREEELRYVLDQSGATGIFLVPHFRTPMLEYLEEVRDRLPRLREVHILTHLHRLIDDASPAERLPEVRPSDPAQIQYTSGTTGFPKGAVLTHRGLTNNARIYGAKIGLRPGEVYLNPMPLFHTAGCAMGVLGSIQARAAHVPLSFDPAVVLHLTQMLGAAVVAGVPTMLIAQLDHPDFNRRRFDSVRLVVSGGSTVPASLGRRVEAEMGATLVIVYGTTECSPLISMTAPDDAAGDRFETLGRPLPQTEVRIAQPAGGAPTAMEAVGEILTRGYHVMRGYHEMLEATKAAIDGDGWYHTGDLGSMDARGYLRIEGRLKDLIIRGGENVYPREVEDLLARHPGVAEAAVVGAPDDRWGEVVVAFVRPAPGEAVDGETLTAYCREHLAAFKCPSRWVFIDGFPLTASGKIQKFTLRERLATEGSPADVAGGGM